MSYFKHVSLADYDLTDKDISQACYDEMRAEGYDIVITEKEMRVLADHRREEFKDWMRPLFAQEVFFMPENTWIYDTVWEEYRAEHGHTIDEMNEFIWQGDRSVIKDLESRANKMMWQMDQRSAWMCGDEPLYRVPEDWPF